MYLKLLLFALLLIATPLKGQQMTVDDVPDLVKMVDAELDLSNKQENQLHDVLLLSFNELTEIRSSSKAEIEKLYLIRLNQENADAQLREIFSKAQYHAYKLFVNGEDELGSDDSFSSDPKTFSGRVEKLAGNLKLSGKHREEFTANLNNLELETLQILNGPNDQTRGVELLVAILSSDLALIKILGKPKYEEFYQLRADGALSDTKNAGESDIELVLMFYDISDALGLTPAQNKEIIRMILLNEMKRESIREQYINSPAMQQEQIRHMEQNALIELQSVLTDEQVNVLLNLMEGQ